MEEALQEKVDSRLRTLQCTQFVATVCDFEDMLMKASTGFIVPELAFVLPIAADITAEETREKKNWKSSMRILGHENCHHVRI